jgi:hypothetical protein
MRGSFYSRPLEAAAASLTAGKLSNVVMVAVMRKSGLHSVPIARYSLG